MLILWALQISKNFFPNTVSADCSKTFQDRMETRSNLPFQNRQTQPPPRATNTFPRILNLQPILALVRAAKLAKILAILVLAPEQDLASEAGSSKYENAKKFADNCWECYDKVRSIFFGIYFMFSSVKVLYTLMKLRRSMSLLLIEKPIKFRVDQANSRVE